MSWCHGVNCGVFQVMKKETFQRILTFCISWKGVFCATDGLVGLVQKTHNKRTFIETVARLQSILPGGQLPFAARSRQNQDLALESTKKVDQVLRLAH